jgi:Leucine-rich repeat (LRR) protein
MIVFQSIDFTRLRSMTVFGKWRSFFISESMKQFRVLDLEDASGVTDPDLERMVKLLPRLRFLSLRGCLGISNLPGSLGDLRQLQTLDVRRTSALSIPASIRKLRNLQYFRAGTAVPVVVGPSGEQHSVSLKRRTHVGARMRRGIGTLSALRTLGDVNVGFKGILKELNKLTQLRKLGVSGINKNNSKQFLSAISVHVHLESLSVRLDNDNQDCLDDIALHLKGLRSLKLYSLGKRIPDWVNQLSKLTKLVLEMVKLKKQGVRLLDKLTELCILRLRVKQLDDGELRFPVTTNGQEEFSNVKILEISCCSRMDVTFGSKAMRNLEVLEVDCCCGQPYQFDGLRNLAELKQVLLKGSYNETLKDDLQSQLKNHEKIPLLKMPEEKPRSS